MFRRSFVAKVLITGTAEQQNRRSQVSTTDTYASSTITSIPSQVPSETTTTRTYETSAIEAEAITNPAEKSEADLKKKTTGKKNEDSERKKREKAMKKEEAQRKKHEEAEKKKEEAEKKKEEAKKKKEEEKKKKEQAERKKREEAAKKKTAADDKRKSRATPPKNLIDRHSIAVSNLTPHEPVPTNLPESPGRVLRTSCVSENRSREESSLQTPTEKKAPSVNESSIPKKPLEAETKNETVSPSPADKPTDSTVSASAPTTASSCDTNGQGLPDCTTKEAPPPGDACGAPPQGVQKQFSTQSEVSFHSALAFDLSGTNGSVPNESVVEFAPATPPSSRSCSSEQLSASLSSEIYTAPTASQLFAKLSASLCQKLIASFFERKTMANNQVFSPLSIGMSLTSLQLGARGRTREQLVHLLDLSPPGSSSGPGGNEPHEGLIAAADAFFAEHMAFARAGFKFSHAGELFCNSDIQVLPSYVGALKDLRGGADVVPVDFSGAPEAAWERINELVPSCSVTWPVKSVIDFEELSANTRLFLNTCYFKGKWAFSVDPRHTLKRAFYIRPREYILMQMMHKYRLCLPYVHIDGLSVKLCALPLASRAGHSCEMVVLLPDHHDGLDVLLAKLGDTPDLLKALLKSLDQQKPVETDLLAMPRLKLDSTAELKEVLEKLGVKDLFDEQQADLSGLSISHLHLSNALHRILLDVSGESRATGATSCAYMSLQDREGQAAAKPSFVCDRPFLFLIRGRSRLAAANPEGASGGTSSADMSEEENETAFVYFVGTYRKP